jgi:hypothetical protein
MRSRRRLTGGFSARGRHRTWNGRRRGRRRRRDGRRGRRAGRRTRRRLRYRCRRGRRRCRRRRRRNGRRRRLCRGRRRRRRHGRRCRGRRRWTCRTGDRTGREQADRIDVALRLRRDADAEVDARDRMLRFAAPPHGADGCALVDRVALRDRDRAEVDYGDGVPVGREDRHATPVGRQRAGERHGSRRRSPNGRSLLAPDVDPSVLPGRVRVRAERERAQHCSVGGPRPGTRWAAQQEGGERRCAGHEETVHETPPSFTARATRRTKGSAAVGRRQTCASSDAR